MRIIGKAPVLVFCFVLSGLSLQGQDSHYNSQQPDSKSTLNGGTGTAGTRELSAVYYNPGVIALFEKSNLGISGNLYAFDFVRLSDEAGSGTSVRGSNFQVIPSLFAGTFKWKNNEKLTTAYAYLNRNFYSNRIFGLSQERSMIGERDVITYDQYDARTRFSEDWIGAGLSYRVNDHLGIGFMTFVHTYTQQFQYRSSVTVTPVESAEEVITSINDYRESRLFSPAFLLNLGVVYSKGEHEFGLNIITPRINVSSLAFSSIERSLLVVNQDTTRFSALIDPNYLAIMKRPLEINLGYAWMHENRSIKVRISYYGNIDRYTMGKTSSGTIRSGVFEEPNENDWLPVSAADQIINLGIGYEWRVNAKLKMISGFRTDFSFFDKSTFKYADFTTQLVYWNIYHVSIGIDWKYKWLQLNTGIDYGFSFQNNLSQFVDFNQFGRPFDGIQLSNTASVNYHQFKVFLGLVLSFNE